MGMWEPPFFGGFQGLWEGWETDSFIVGLPCFPSDRHLHCFCRRRADFIVWPVQPSTSLLVATLAAVGLHRRSFVVVLLRLDRAKHMTKPLVLDDRRVTYPLIFLEDAIGKRVPSPAYLQWSIREVVELNILTGELFRHHVPRQDDLLPVVRQRQLRTNVALLSVAQDVADPAGSAPQLAMQIVGPRSTYGEAFVEARDEAWQERVAGFDGADVSQAQLLHEPVLQRTVGPFHAALGLAGVRAQDLDVQFCEGAPELRHPGATLRIRLVHPEHGVLIGVESDRAAVALEIPFKRLEVAVRALAGHEAQLHHSAGRIIDKDQQRARLATPLEPTVLGTVDLHQLAHALAPKP